MKYAHELYPDGSLYKIDFTDRVYGVVYGDANKEITNLEPPSAIDLAGIDSGSKPHVFIAMPFRKELEEYII